MIILGIESSCDETAASVLEIAGGKVKIISNVVSSQIKIHKKYGGVVPEVAARKHAEVIFDVIGKAIKQESNKARKQKNVLEGIDLIAVTYGPGLVTSLRVGVLAAETIALLIKKPLVGVNHIEAHLLSAFLSATLPQSSPLKRGGGIRFPALGLIVSGGHTELVLVKGIGKYQLIGSTRDDAVGEAFDKVAKILGLGYPGGPAIAKVAEKHLSHCERPEGARQSQENMGLPRREYAPPHFAKASRGRRNDSEIVLPRPMINSNDFDFSFSGLKTAVLYLAKQMSPAELKKNTPAIATEFQKAAVEVLVAKTKKAAEKYKVKNILVGGGVSANRALRAALSKLNYEVHLPELAFTGDNAAMIAFAGYHKYQKSKKARKQENIYKIVAEPNLRI